MKTKEISIYNLRAGQKIVLETVPRDVSRDGRPQAFSVSHIAKGRAIFAGGAMFQVRYSDPLSSLGYGTFLAFGRFRGRKADKVLVAIE